jgi:hypothetical protein
MDNTAGFPRMRKPNFDLADSVWFSNSRQQGGAVDI